jgi:hypothetical protein
MSSRADRLAAGVKDIMKRLRRGGIELDTWNGLFNTTLMAGLPKAHGFNDGRALKAEFFRQREEDHELEDVLTRRERPARSSSAPASNRAITEQPRSHKGGHTQSDRAQRVTSSLTH